MSRTALPAIASSLAAAVLMAAGGRAAGPREVVLPASSLTVERVVPLSQVAPGRVKISLVDPLAIYSNVTTFTSQAFGQAAASGGITRLVMDDLTFTTNPGVGSVTAIRFTVANLNGTPQSVRAHLRFWNADGAALGAGLPNGPGTYYAPGGTPVGYTFAAATYSPGVTTLTADVSGNPLAVPAGATTTLWSGITFDNVGTTTGATDTELSNFGQGVFTPVDLGSSTDTVFETTAAGSFFPTASPPGAAVIFGTPTSNLGWELVVTTLPVELMGVSVD